MDKACPTQDTLKEVRRGERVRGGGERDQLG